LLRHSGASCFRHRVSTPNASGILVKRNFAGQRVSLGCEANQRPKFAMPKFVATVILSSAIVLHIRGDGFAMQAPAASDVPHGNSGFFDDFLGEALGEACCTFGFFAGIWACGRLMGWKLGPKSGKKPSKLGLGRKQASRIPSMAVALKQAPGMDDGAVNSSVVQRSQGHMPSHQSKRSLITEGDMLAGAVRAGNAKELPRMMDASIARVGPTAVDVCDLTQALLLVSLRACAANRCFPEALSLYSHVQPRLSKACSNTWSILLWSAVEAARFDKCVFFWSGSSKWMGLLATTSSISQGILSTPGIPMFSAKCWARFRRAAAKST